MRLVVAALLAAGVLGTGAPDGRDEALPGWFDLPVQGGAATLEALGISLEERAFTLPILARALYDRESRVSLSAAGLIREVAATAARTVENGPDREVIGIPAPLDAPIWRELLPPAKTDDTFVRILTDRNALLLAVGLMSADDSLRALAASDSDLLRVLYRDAAAPFVVASRRLRVSGGRVLVPGGPGADAIWQVLAGESPARPAPFIRALLLKDDGRLAWYFETIGGLTSDRLDAAWPEGSDRLQAATALYDVFRTSDPQWRIAEQPFQRGVIDAWTMVTQNAISNGRLDGSWQQSFWELLFYSEHVQRARASQVLGETSAPLTLAWLTRETLTPVTRERRHRFEMFRLAQRQFSSVAASALPDVAVAVSGLRRFRALLLALERMQISNPQTWALVIEAATHVSDHADNRRESIMAFQGVIALLERMRHVRTLDVPTTDRLLRSLSQEARADKRVIRTLKRWVPITLVGALPRLVRPDAWTTQTAFESTLLQALAGPTIRPTRTIDWEGLTYVVDVAAAEHDRLRAMRALLPSPGLDVALQNGRPGDLAAALAALVYATALGDPDGAASLSPQVVTRHDLGIDAKTIIRETAPWAPPEERQVTGPWRVQGSLIGLDLGLSRLSLRRVADQQMPAAPTLTLNDLGTLTRTTVVMSAADLVDAQRDELAAAIARGRERVAQAGPASAWASLGREIGMSDVTRELLPWVVLRQRESAAQVFSLRDLMWLGQPRLSAADIDLWGVAGDAIDGRRTTLMPRPGPWEDYTGRSEAGQITTQVPDLTLRLVEGTAQRSLPASLVPALLNFALADYWHDVHARFADDWFQLTRQAAALSSARIEDYVAALTGNGPLRAQ